jgi:RNA polymerase sigma-70 factor (ECF subfamily)
MAGRRNRAHGSADDGDEQLFRSLYPSLRAYAAAIGSWDLEPDDLVQEALARTLRRHRLVELEAPGAYLRTAILNLAISESRRRTRTPRGRSTPDERSGTAQELPSDLSDLERLTPMDRAVLYLVHVERYPHREVAKLLGITEQASRSRSSRATRQLRHEITEEEATT